MYGDACWPRFWRGLEARKAVAMKGELGKGHQESNLNLYETSYQSTPRALADLHSQKKNMYMPKSNKNLNGAYGHSRSRRRTYLWLSLKDFDASL
jgi:hypothetical protein